MKDLEEFLGEVVDDRPRQREFTVHVGFLASDQDEARYYAAAYVEALNDLRPEVDSFRARMSAGKDWSRSESVFCLVYGPDPEDVCLDIARHPGDHHGPGPSSSWRDDQVPRMPDTIADLG